MIYTMFGPLPLKLSHFYSLCLEFKAVRLQTEAVNRSGVVNCVPGKYALFFHVSHKVIKVVIVVKVVATFLRGE